VVGGERIHVVAHPIWFSRHDAERTAATVSSLGPIIGSNPRFSRGLTGANIAEQNRRPGNGTTGHYAMLPYAITSFAHAKCVLAIILATPLACSNDVVLAQTAAGEATNPVVDERTAATIPPGQAGEPRRVLVLYWYGKDYPSNVAFDRH